MNNSRDKERTRERKEERKKERKKRKKATCGHGTSFTSCFDARGAMEEKDTVSSHPSNKCNCPMCKNGYHLRKKIGEGGFGAVYTSSKDDLAIKITSNCDLNDSIMEYKVLMQVAGHTHILQPIDFYLHHGAPVLVTELIHGGDLASRIGNGAEFSTDELARIAEQMLSALAHIHGKGFIHRDVKSDNILCVSKSFFKLADFGLCCASSRKRQNDASWHDISHGARSSERQRVLWEKGRQLLAWRDLGRARNCDILDEQVFKLKGRNVASSEAAKARDWHGLSKPRAGFDCIFGTTSKRRCDGATNSRCFILICTHHFASIRRV